MTGASHGLTRSGTRSLVLIGRSLERSGFAITGGEHGREELKDSGQISNCKNLGFCYRGGFVFDFSCLVRLDGTEEWWVL